MHTTVPVSPALARALAAIDSEREAAFDALREANRAGLTGASLSDVMARFDAVTERVAQVKAEHFGQSRYRNHRLVVALGSASLVSPTGRSGRPLWSRA